MTVYSYNANQLQKKVAPKKPFWSGNKIAAAAGSLLILSFGVLAANTPAPVVSNKKTNTEQIIKSEVIRSAPVTLPEAAVVEPVNDMPEACVRAKVTREECDQAIALYNAQQNQGPTWSGQEFNENQRKAWAQ